MSSPTTHDSGRGASVPGFWAFAQHEPERVATVDVDGTGSTFGVMLDRVNALSHLLRRRGISEGSPLAVLLRDERRP